MLRADLKPLNSLAIDLMEALRPRVDSYVLQLRRSHAFAARDFLETRHGVCRLIPSLTNRLAEAAPSGAKEVAAVAKAFPARCSILRAAAPSETGRRRSC